MSKRMTAAGTLTAAVALTIAIAAAAAPPPVDFSGTWVFKAERSTLSTPPPRSWTQRIHISETMSPISYAPRPRHG